jgi:hypothetical protein
MISLRKPPSTKVPPAVVVGVPVVFLAIVVFMTVATHSRYQESTAEGIAAIFHNRAVGQRKLPTTYDATDADTPVATNRTSDCELSPVADCCSPGAI